MKQAFMNVQIEAQYKKRLLDIAKREHLTLSAMLRRVLIGFIEQKESEQKAA